MRPSVESEPHSLDDVMSMVVFAAVVDAGSFTAAAKALDLGKSVVSARVARLEQQLGVKLLHRTTRRVALTPAGASLYPACAEVARAAAEVRLRAHGDSEEPRGRLRINAPVAFGRRWLSDPIAGFVAKYPGVHVELSLQDDFVDPTQWDVVIRFGEVHDLDLVARRLARMPVVVAASPAYLEAHGVPRHPLELVGHACLRYAHVGRDREWSFKGQDSLLAVPVSGPVTATDSGALVELAERGVGVVSVPWFLVCDAIWAGRLVRILGDFALGELGGLSCQAVHAHGSRAPARVRAWIDHLVACFEPPPWGNPA
jgi:DNA-binding transcriptional LysR family regulator